MTKVALSLACLSHPDAQYHPRRSPRVARGSSWAREHGYELDQTAAVDISVYAGGRSPEHAALGALQQQLLASKIERGTVLVLDDYGSLTEEEMRDLLPHIMSIAASGMHVVTLRDKKLWDATAMNNLGGLVMSIVLDYADNLRGQYMSCRMRAVYRYKQRKAEDAAAKESTE